MIQRHIEAWKRFLEGRIDQEHGREDDSLRKFEQALEIDPDNPHFRQAHEVARGRLGRDLNESEERLLASIESTYQEFNSAGTNLRTERVQGLKQMLAELDRRPLLNGAVRTYLGGLHCG